MMGRGRMRERSGGLPGHIVFGGIGVGQLCCPRLVLGEPVRRQDG